MISLNTDEKRNLQFEVSIQGINHKELQGALTFIIEDVKYGFPVKILADHISAEVPPLDDIVKRGMKDGDIIECKLDVYGNGFYLNPWEGQFKLKTPVRMEARMSVIEDSPDIPMPKHSKKIVATLKEDDDIEDEIVENVEEQLVYEEEDKRKDKLSYDEIDRDDLLKELFTKVESKLFNKLEKTGVLKERKNQAIKEVKEQSKRDKTKSLAESKLNQMSNMLDKYLPKSNTKKITPVKEKKKIQNKKSSSLLEKYGSDISNVKPKSKPKEISTSDNPIAIMESFGMKNPKIQKMMLEKAESIGGDNIASTLINMLSPSRVETPYEGYIRKKAEEDKGL